jgi:PPOX class probable FMN-dependent enzyme
MSRITSREQLRERYPPATERARNKDIGHLDKHCRRFIELSPFVVLSSFHDSKGADASPRGGRPGFVKVADAQTLILPDWRGNNRLDTLENLLDDPAIGLMFMIPGVDEVLRINGRAELRSDESYRALCREGDRLPGLVILVQVREAYLHCAKAIMRASLWEDKARIDRNTLPSAGQILKEQMQLDIEPESREAMTERYRKSLY